MDVRTLFFSASSSAQTNKEKLLKKLTKIFSYSPNAIVISKLQGGFSIWSKVYKVQIGGRLFVARIIHANNDREALLRNQEVSMMRLLSDCNVTPVVHHAADDVVIMDYIEDIPNWRLNITDAIICSCAALLRQMHSIKLAMEFKMQENHRIFNFVIKKALGYAGQDARFSHYKVVVSCVYWLEAKLKEYQVNNICHYDLHLANMLYDGKRFYFIDLENISIGDGLFDVATISIYFSLNAKQENLLLNTYFSKNPTSVELKRYFLAKQLAYLYFSLGTFFTCESHDFHFNSSELSSFSLKKYSTNSSDLLASNLDNVGRYKLSIRFLNAARDNFACSEYTKEVAALLDGNLYSSQVFPMRARL